MVCTSSRRCEGTEAARPTRRLLERCRLRLELLLSRPNRPPIGAADPAREEIRQLAEALRQIDERLAESVRRLPRPAARFDALAEIRVAIECVRADLLADAIETLTVAGVATESQLWRCFEERQKWAAAARA